MSLLAPLFAAGLLLLAWPLWLHRRASREDVEDFPSLRFVVASDVAPAMRGRQLRHRRLLLLRCALLAVLAAFFTGPVLDGLAVPAPAAATREHVVVLDASLSMQVAGRADAARAAARRIAADAAAAAEPVRVLALATDLEPLDVAPAAAIAAYAPGHAAATFAGLLARIDRAVGPATTPRSVHIVSDLQASALPAHLTGLLPAPGTGIVLHAAGGAGDAPANVAITGLEVAPAAAGGLEATVSVASFAGVAASRRVVLSIDGEPAGSADVDVAPAATGGAGGRAVVVLPLPAASGERLLSVRLLPADALAADDVRWHVLRQQAPPRWLHAATGDDARARPFVAAALAAAGARVETQAAASLDALPADVAGVWLQDPGELDARFERELDAFVSAGGALVVDLGPRSAGRSPAGGAGRACGARGAGGCAAPGAGGNRRCPHRRRRRRRAAAAGRGPGAAGGGRRRAAVRRACARRRSRTGAGDAARWRRHRPAARHGVRAAGAWHRRPRQRSHRQCGLAGRGAGTAAAGIAGVRAGRSGHAGAGGDAAAVDAVSGRAGCT
jgi:hypothetical protein